MKTTVVLLTTQLEIFDFITRWPLLTALVLTFIIGYIFLGDSLSTIILTFDEISSRETYIVSYKGPLKVYIDSKNDGKVVIYNSTRGRNEMYDIECNLLKDGEKEWLTYWVVMYIDGERIEYMSDCPFKVHFNCQDIDYKEVNRKL